MQNTNNAASVVTVVALLITVQYTSGYYNFMDALLALIVVVVFWSTRKEWGKDKLVRAIASIGIAVSALILYGVVKRGIKIATERGPEGLIKVFFNGEMITIGLISVFCYFVAKCKYGSTNTET